MEKKLQKISYIWKCASARFMPNPLSNLVNDLNQWSEGIHKIEYKHEHDEKNLRLLELNISIATVFLNTQILKVIW